jgi:hypothetical protein
MPHFDAASLETKTAAPSAARLAADSAFLTTATAPTVDDGPVVIVRRRKVVVDDYERHHDAGDQNEASRSPKVFRVESGSLEDVKKSAAEPGVASLSDDDASLSQDDRVPVSRRRRRQKHGSVTIIRTAPPTAMELAQRTQRVKEQYESLRAELRKLDREIETAREVEVGKAVSWIRKAIAEYDLHAKDLGL